MPTPFQTYSGEMISELNNDTSSFAGKIVYWKTGAFNTIVRTEIELPSLIV